MLQPAGRSLETIRSVPGIDFLAFSEDNYTVDQSEKSVVLAHTYVEAGVVNCATLTLDDVAGFAMLTTENLYSESFAF